MRKGEVLEVIYMSLPLVHQLFYIVWQGEEEEQQSSIALLTCNFQRVKL